MTGGKCKQHGPIVPMTTVAARTTGSRRPGTEETQESGIARRVALRMQTGALKTEGAPL
jgi:hypothetical protein